MEVLSNGNVLRIRDDSGIITKDRIAPIQRCLRGQCPQPRRKVTLFGGRRIKCSPHMVS